MPDLTHLLGTELEPHEATVDRRATMNYAAGTGHQDPRYYDEEAPGGLVAPPLFAVAASWPLVGRLPQALDVPPEVLLSGVHYLEHLRFERLLRPGERVSISGRVAAVLPHRAGTLLVLELPVRDTAEALVHTEHLGILLRGTPCDGPGAGGDRIPDLPAAPAADAPSWEETIPIHPLAPWVYDACSDIVFGIHTVPRMARALGLPGIVLQGTATLAFAVRRLLDREAGGDPGRLRALGCRFRGWVLPGTDVTLSCVTHRAGPSGTELRFLVRSGEGREAVSDGRLVLG